MPSPASVIQSYQQYPPLIRNFWLLSTTFGCESRGDMAFSGGGSLLLNVYVSVSLYLPSVFLIMCHVYFGPALRRVYKNSPIMAIFQYPVSPDA